MQSPWQIVARLATLLRPPARRAVLGVLGARGGPPAALAGAVLAVLVLVACSPTGAATPERSILSPLPAQATPPAAAPTRTDPRPDCPRLGFDLRQLLEAPDPAAFVAGRGIEYQAGRVLVYVQLVSEEGDLAQRYALQVSTRYRDRITALVPLATLCELSNDPRVHTVETPPRAAPRFPPTPLP